MFEKNVSKAVSAYLANFKKAFLEIFLEFNIATPLQHFGILYFLKMATIVVLF